MNIFGGCRANVLPKICSGHTGHCGNSRIPGGPCRAGIQRVPHDLRQERILMQDGALNTNSRHLYEGMDQGTVYPAPEPYGGRRFSTCFVLPQAAAQTKPGRRPRHRRPRTWTSAPQRNDTGPL